jgi:hypothetical protein
VAIRRLSKWVDQAGNERPVLEGAVRPVNDVHGRKAAVATRPRKVSLGSRREELAASISRQDRLKKRKSGVSFRSARPRK